MSGLLVIVPCGRAKIWSREPDKGPVVAQDAYVGPPFKVNRAYAERFGQEWVILSAKYGFISPNFMIPGPYDVTFSCPSTRPVTVEKLREQVRTMDLDRFNIAVGLGGADYCAMMEGAFRSFPVRLCFPFRGLTTGRAMAATKCAVIAGDPCGPSTHRCCLEG